MSTPPAPDALARYHTEVSRHYRWNLIVFLLYGLLGTTGWRLILAPTFVPDYLYRLGGSNLLVGLVLFAGGLCRFASPLAGAAWITGRRRVKRAAIKVGAGMRVQVLGMAVVALVLPEAWNLPAFVVLYAVFSVLLGLQHVTFGLLMAKIIPARRRGRFIGLRDFAGGASAAGVALLATRFFDAMAFPASYGLTYLTAFVLTSLGLVCFGALREPASPITHAPRSLAATLGLVVPILRTDPSFAGYCLARALAALALMAAPFFIIAMAEPADLGRASVAFFAAGTLGNLLWGQLADHVGFRIVFVLSAAVWLGALAMALAAPAGAVVALFALIGVGQGGLQMASVNLVYELADHTELGVRIAIVNAMSELMMAVAPLVGGAIADRWSYDALYAVAAVFTVAAGATMYLRVGPRRDLLSGPT